MQLSATALVLLMELEGFSPEPYECAAGCWTVGFGHRIKPGESVPSVTREEAGRILREDVRASEDVVNGLVLTPLTQNEFDALVLFVFNVGPTGFASSTLLRLLNKGDFEGAAGEFNRWVHATRGGRKVRLPGLVRRREVEKRLFLGAA